MQPFVALDFETADSGRDSACAVAAVRVERNQIVRRFSKLIRPPRKVFTTSHIHGITWEDVAGAPTFQQVWPDLKKEFEGAAFIAAHYAPFDKGVLRKCCERARRKLPEQDFVCTVKIAREAWGIRPTKLDMVCRRLQIPLNHHEALSDAEACARIVIAANREGHF